MHYQFFEKPMQKLSLAVNFIVTAFFVAVVIIISFVSVYKKTTEIPIFSNITTIKDSIEYNAYLHNECTNYFPDCVRDDFLNIYFATFIEGIDTSVKKCVWDFKNNKQKVAVLAGNSFMKSYAKSVVQAIKESRHGWKFGKIYLLTQSGCPIFYSLDTEQKFICPMSHKIFQEIMSNLMPDLFITINRIDFFASSTIPLADPQVDNLTILLSAELKKYATYAKEIVILEPNFVAVS